MDTSEPTTEEYDRNIVCGEEDNSANQQMEITDTIPSNRDVNNANAHYNQPP